MNFGKNLYTVLLFYIYTIVFIEMFFSYNEMITNDSSKA
jgi:hypothetical protein